MKIIYIDKFKRIIIKENGGISMKYTELKEELIKTVEVLNKEKRKQLLENLKLYTVIEEKVDVKDVDGNMYPETKETTVYEEVSDSELKEIEDLQNLVETLQGKNKKLTSVNGLYTTLNILAGLTIFGSIILAAPMLSEPLLSGFSTMIIASGLIGGLMIFSFATVIKLLNEISFNTQK